MTSFLYRTDVEGTVSKNHKDYKVPMDDIKKIVEEFEEKFGSKTGGAMPSGFDTAENIKSFLRSTLTPLKVVTKHKRK